MGSEGRPLLVSVESGAAALGIGRTQMFRLLRSGDVESLKIGARRLIPTDSLREYVARQRGEQAPELGGDGRE
jgi:excisionase family DNA binding protein